MGRKVFRGIGDVAACFEEPNTLGSELDIDAPRNTPMKDPINHLSAITWHSAFDQFELAVGPTDVVIGHTSLAPLSTVLGIGSLSYVVHGDRRETDILLVNHNQGYKPRAKVTIGGRVISAGQMIQDSTQYRRTISVFSTTTGVYLRETAYSSDVELPAHNQSYRVYVFRQAQPTPGVPLFSKSGGVMTLARGMVRSDGKYLRRTGAGDEEFSLDSGPTLDVSNGHKRVANGGVLTTETGYNGSMAAPAYVQVGL
ncbi:MAG TPA: hypothetical protein VGN60_09190 [Devosia sp.]|nr:hypothetical protein [Devosia sp.]